MPGLLMSRGGVRGGAARQVDPSGSVFMTKRDGDQEYPQGPEGNGFGDDNSDPNMQTQQPVPGTQDQGEFGAEPPQDASDQSDQGGPGDGDGTDQEGPQDDSTEASNGQEASPQEQAAYNQFVVNGMNLIFGSKDHPGFTNDILDRIKGAHNPVEGLAETTAQVVFTLQKSAKQQGQDIDPAIMMHGGAELLDNIALLAKEARVHDFTDQEKENASYAAIDKYSVKAGQQGMLDTNSIAQGFQQIQAADKAGKLNQLLPGIDQAAAQFKKRGVTPPQPGAGAAQPDTAAPQPANMEA